MNRFLSTVKRKLHRTHPTKIWIGPAFVGSFVGLFLCMFSFTYLGQQENLPALWSSLGFTAGLFSGAISFILFVFSVFLFVAWADHGSPWNRAETPWNLSDEEYIRRFETPTSNP